MYNRANLKPPKLEVTAHERDSEDTTPLLMSSPIPVEIPILAPAARKTSKLWVGESGSP